MHQVPYFLELIPVSGLTFRFQDAIKPLYLVLACEELRVFGVFEKVHSFLKKLPGTVSELLLVVLDRVIKDSDSELAIQALALLARSKGGLEEDELRWLLGSKKGPLPQSQWAALYRNIKPYLKSSGASSTPSRLHTLPLPHEGGTCHFFSTGRNPGWLD